MTSPRLLRLNLVLVACGAAIAGAWIYATGGVEGLAASRPDPWHAALLVACTAFCVLVRFVRWQFLLRRVDVRLPARGSLFIYCASLVGTATPAYVGEVVRSALLKRRFGAPVRLTATVLIVERIFDAAALGLIGAASAAPGWTRMGLLAVVAAACAAAVGLRRAAPLAGIGSAVLGGLFAVRVWVPALALSLVAWVPAAALVNVAAASLGTSVPLVPGMGVFSASTLVGGLSLMPAGVGVTGSVAILQLQRLGLTLEEGIRVVSLLRLGTIGVSLVFGMACLLLALRSRERRAAADAAAHFDCIAAEYGDQFRPHVWQHLLQRKTDLIRTALCGRVDRRAVGLDLGCGLGHQSRALRTTGLNVVGMEPAWNLARHAHRAGVPVVAGTALSLPFADHTIDFVYAVGVLHHLPDRAAQQVAAAEAWRVLKPGGLLLVHETNPLNVLFRFYMGYVFPVLKSIDEGTECWIAPDEWGRVTGMRLTRVEYFTFFPDFVPRALMPSVSRLSARLEASRLARYSAHYFAVLQKTETGPPSNGDAHAGRLGVAVASGAHAD